ncbi:MAG: ACT domain-containing protein [Pseudomonadota bacterium]
MSGEMDLRVLLTSLDAVADEAIYVFVTVDETDVPSGINARMVFQEAEGTTLILLKEEAVRLGIPYEFPCHMITLNVHSALNAVGFIAHVASALASANMGVNPVAGYFHDHLFVPEGRQNDALDVLERLKQEAQSAAFL